MIRTSVQLPHEFCRDFPVTWCWWGPASAATCRWLPRPAACQGRIPDGAGHLRAGIPPLKRGVPTCPIALVHGWRDEVIPYEQSMRFAKENKLALHLVESDHRLHSQLHFIRFLFQYFLIVNPVAPSTSTTEK
jgi:hypothetical protein